MLNRKMNSGITLQLTFFTTCPVQGNYTLDYKMNYSMQESKWQENVYRTKAHKSRPCQFQYNLQAEKQDVSYFNFLIIICFIFPPI